MPGTAEQAGQLICQIADGFLASARRKPHELRPFEELLVHLFPRADLFARSVVAQKLAKRPDLPRRILQMFLNDELAVAEPLAMHSPLLTPEDIVALIGRNEFILRQALARRDDLSLAQKQALAVNTPSLRSSVKREAPKPLVIDIPRTAPAAEVYTLEEAEIRAPIVLPPQLLAQRDAAPQFTQAMVRAAVLRRSQDIAALLAKEIDLPLPTAQALLKDESGEALVAACRHLGVPEDASMQVATLLYPALTRTREQLTALRKTYHGFSPQATARIVEAWRALPQGRALHESVHGGASVRHEAPTPAPAQAADGKRASNQ